MINNAVKEMIEEFTKINEVEGILLAGSRATNTYDDGSDYDIYIYSTSEISIDRRKEITDKYFSYIELNNTFWEAEDDGFLKEANIPVEIIYRDIKWLKDSLDRTVKHGEASIGYSTCFWSSFINSIILYDKNNYLQQLQKLYDVQYPKTLKENIIKKNYPLLKLQMPAYYYQIEKALKRDDFVSVNHRVAAFLASYFDIIFAVNEFQHPGEKKILKIVKDKNFNLPKEMEANVLGILENSAPNKTGLLNIIDLLVSNLDDFLKRENLYFWEKNI
ncbi:nucleotidyltransferase domain-containing protein [Clostridium sp. C8-1-8]|uniref:nucleotidyltransferase domain-containing protein n=1 Tax=Clostridium sp. C8-1-8 TaxID=2698831 RepID=UPI00136E7026|nr:nucleotidyltransferase domain-containing protein [Clostridium sp. C8-1-8]